MNKLVLIGNGFDLAHGLKTSYADFILWYLNKRFSQMLKQFPDDLIISIEAPLPFRSKEFKSLYEYSQFVKDYQLKIEFKNGFFRELVIHASKKKWVDIENMYYQRLITYVKSIEKQGASSPVVDEVKKLNVCFELIKTNLREYLNSLDYSINPLVDISRHFMDITKQDEQNAIDHVLVANFNYTSLLNLFQKELVHSKVINIHGSLENKENPIIFGYGDEIDPYYEKIEGLNDNEYLRNIKSFGYLKTHNYRAIASFIHSNNYRVFIMGHSCGLSDRILLSTIFQHANCKGIRIYYHQKNESENDFVEKTQEISRHFTAENKGRMRTLITPFSESEPLVKWNGGL